MVRYETLILAVPEITAHETTNLEEKFGQIVQKNSSTVLSFDRWGKYRLAYPIRKNDYGVYFLARFEAEKKDVVAITKEIDNLFKIKVPNIIMRFLTIQLDPKKPLEYQKPSSLEDIPSQDVDTFLRENKMGGLLKGSSGADQASRGRFTRETVTKDAALEPSQSVLENE